MGPPVIAIASLAATAIGAGISAYGAMAQGAAQSSMFNYQARVAQINQQINMQNARYEIQRGEVSAQTAGLQERSVIGASRAAMGASGVAVGEGSSADVLGSEQMLGEHDVAVIRSDAARRAYGYETMAFGNQAQGMLDIAAATGATGAGELGAFTSVLGGAASVSDRWLRYGPSFAQTASGSPATSIYGQG